MIASSLWAAPAGPAILRVDGIGPAATPVRFGTASAAALTRLAPLLGKPLKQRTIADCGQGEPMREVTFGGHLVLTFFHGHFSGWTLSEGNAYRTDKGLGIGSPRAAVVKADPDTSVDDGPLGVTFGSDNGVSGFLDADRPGARVTGLYAGETCMVS